LIDFSEKVKHPVCKIDVKTIFINELGLYAIFPIPKVANLISLISLSMPYTIGFFKFVPITLMTFIDFRDYNTPMTASNTSSSSSFITGV
jgi:hypothetical protein